MTIRNKLQISIVISVLFGAAMIGVMLMLISRTGSISARQSLYQKTMVSVFEINTQAHQHLEDVREPLDQWDAVNALLAAILDKIQPASTEEKFLLESLRENYQSVNAIFQNFQSGKVTSAGKTLDGQLESIVTAQLSVKLTNMLLDASSLVESNQKELHAASKRAGIKIISLFILLIFLNGVISYVTGKHIASSLTELRSGVDRISRDDLDHRICVKSDDEISHLSMAFNAMADRLQVSYRELHETNEALALYARKLEFQNQELQDFTFITSHDLQEPLRKIQAMSDRVKSRWGSVLDDEGRDYLNRIERTAHRMQSLILDLLKYSRLATEQEPRAPVDLKLPVEEAVMDLGLLIEETCGSVEISNLPSIEANPAQMRELFENLIANGLKFNRNATPVVRVYGSDCSNQTFTIMVEDNGIGFDEKYLDRIFKPFQRLHQRHEYGGTGIGLAICRRIVERHNGTITARSSPGKGTTFIIALPKRISRGDEHIEAV